MRKNRLKLRYLSLGLLVLVFCVSVMASAHAHGKISDESVHSCAVCHNGGPRASSLPSVASALWIQFQSQAAIVDQPLAPLLISSFRALSIRGPPLA